MLTLDSTTLFFYSRIVSNNNKPVPLSKKRKAEHDPISTWIDNVKPHAPPPSRASSTSKSTLWSASFNPPPSLTIGSTCSLHSTLTDSIRITQNVLLPTTAINKEPKEACIEVTDKGVFSDYDETEGQEREKALASGTKHGVHASSLVSHIHIFWSISALLIHQNIVTEDPPKSVAPPSKSSRPFMKSGLPDGLEYGLLHRTIVPTVITYFAHQRDLWDHLASILCNEIRTIIRHTGNVNFEVNPKGSIYKNVHTCTSSQWYTDSSSR